MAPPPQRRLGLGLAAALLGTAAARLDCEDCELLPTEEFFQDVFGRNSEELLDDWKFWIGGVSYVILLSLEAFAIKKPERFTWAGRASIRYVSTFAFNLLVLSLVQYWKGPGVVLTFLLVAGTTLFWVYWSWAPPRDLRKLKALTIFLELDSPLIRCLVVFVGQLLLTVFYGWAMSRGVDDLDRNGSYSLWVAAYVSVQAAAVYCRGIDSVVGVYQKTEEFAFLLKGRVHAYKGAETVKLDPWDLRMRMVMDLLINGVARDIIGFTLPLLLMQSEDVLEFVKDALVVAFITKLDDQLDGGEYIVEALL